MIAWFSRFRPDHMAGQIALLVLAAILIFHFSIIATNEFSGAQTHRPIVDPADVIASAVVAIDAAAPDRRQDIVARLAQTAPWANLTIRQAPPPEWSSDDLSANGRNIGARLGHDADVREPPGVNDHGELYAVKLRNGDSLMVSVPEPRRVAHSGASRAPAERGFSPARIWERFAALFLICVLILSLWLSAKVVSPLVRLAEQAEKFPDDMADADRAHETGPREVVELSRAMNRMRDRIRSMIASRSHALAAISHDLRTIITRMRLRSEFVEDADLREKMLKDIQSMDAMLRKNLEFLRDGDGDAVPERRPIDIDSLLQTLADEFSETGRDVSFRGGARQAVSGSFPELQRLFSNLIENGVRYGKRVDISVRAAAPDAVEIDVADDGPGIAPKDRERVLKPFVRGEAARSMNEKEGFGLGLSIAQSLAQRASGSLTLLENTPHGLIARVRLPLAGVDQGVATIKASQTMT
jgi:signal transduction histidine kinase